MLTCILWIFNIKTIAFHNEKGWVELWVMEYIGEGWGSWMPLIDWAMVCVVYWTSHRSIDHKEICLTSQTNTDYAENTAML